MKKILTAAALTAAAIGLPLATAGAAMADGSQGSDSDSLVTVGEGSCVAPWWWEGPVTVLNGPEDYSACNGEPMHVKPGDLAGALDDSCILPWHWEGPGTAGDDILGTLLSTPEGPQHYKACNDEH
ncbi:MAG TPA: hypothetical protein VFN97_01995 [Actinospica sp.]|nr:hypothetical protein [Actinospica sp.]